MESLWLICVFCRVFVCRLCVHTGWWMRNTKHETRVFFLLSSLDCRRRWRQQRDSATILLCSVRARVCVRSTTVETLKWWQCAASQSHRAPCRSGYGCCCCCVLPLLMLLAFARPRGTTACVIPTDGPKAGKCVCVCVCVSMSVCVSAHTTHTGTICL